MPSETAARRDITTPYCKGNGCDIGSGGDPVVPWAIQVELAEKAFFEYGHAHEETLAAQWRGTGTDLPFKDGVLDWVYSSHLLEDFDEWLPILVEWDRVLKPGGYLIVMVPDHKLFRQAVAAGQGDNLSHKHESHAGELSGLIGPLGYDIKFDGVTDAYNILCLARKWLAPPPKEAP